jgi:hypothetical protein
MSTPNDTAFPVKRISGGNDGYLYERGLTKREYFAAVSLQGFLSTLVSDSQVKALAEQANNNKISTQVLIAKMSVAAADALIAALEQPQAKE